ncbi:MAG TPA: NADH-ubiquinone oxidoreductase-F iron-sulfur binding region domain-containing protein [Acidimicrobiales bacterium]|nr:NADH-ubiquinone oxidoreductase-F iron-sulfur binding region domain-containing protein [Acidimicrobiales bacterium]
MSPTRSSTRATQQAVDPGATALPRLLATAGDPSFDGHFRKWGQMPGGGLLLIDEVQRAGLRGRGGAAFPTYRKLATVSTGRRPVVVANGTEGEPASIKDKTLLVSAPHLVLDGVGIAADTVGAVEAVICVDRSDAASIKALSRALSERSAAQADRVGIRLEAAPSRYVTGEESALVHWLNGGEAKPTFVPPRPFERGVSGRPTLVNNVETLANLALVARYGSRWFRSLGTAEDPGTALVTVLGDVASPGVYEFPFGTQINEIFRAAGAGSSAHSVLAGGYAGTWLPAASAAKLSLDRASFASTGAVIGCGSMLVLGEGTCGLATAARIVHWMAGQSAGQCGPCVNGLPAIANALDGLAAGDHRRRWHQQLLRWLDMAEGRGACHHPDGTVRMVRSALATFAKEIDNHRRYGPCKPGQRAVPLPRMDGPWK